MSTQHHPARHEAPTTPNRPRLIHTVHHVEPDGTTHTMCGQTFTAKSGTKDYNTIACVVCEAACIVMDVQP